MAQPPYTLMPVQQQAVRPSEAGARDANAALMNIIARMNGDGANQLVGYRLAAGLRADRMQEQLDEQMGQFNNYTGEQAEQARQDTLAHQDAQRRNALAVTAINNPAGAAALAPDAPGYSLLDPTARADYGRMREAQIGALERRGTGAGGGAGSAQAARLALAERRLELQVQRASQTRDDRITAAVQRLQSELQREQRMLESSPNWFMLTPDQQSAAREGLLQRYSDRIDQIEGTRGSAAGTPGTAPQGGVQGSGVGSGGAQPERPANPVAAPLQQSGTATPTMPRAAPSAGSAPPLPPNPVVGQTYTFPNGRVGRYVLGPNGEPGGEFD